VSKLTVKQLKFIESYIVSGNATQAAIEAGYSRRTAYKTGSENLKKPQLLKKLEKRTEEIRDEKIVDQREIMEFISATQRGEIREVVVTPGGAKVEVPAKISDRLKAAELMGKRYAMWTEKRDVTATVGPVQIADDIPAGSDEDG